MKVYTCTSFYGFCPTGSAAVVVAMSTGQAQELLWAKLVEIGLAPNENNSAPGVLEMKPLDADTAAACILYDGNY